MNKFLTLIGTAMLFTGLRSNAQSPQQPVKKETTKTVKVAAPKSDAVPIYLFHEDRPSQGGSISGGSTPPPKGSNPAFFKNTKPAAIKGAAIPPTVRQVTPRVAPSPAPPKAVPRRSGAKG